MNRARKAATTLTEPEIAEIMVPLQQCEKRLREGVATEDQVIVLASHMRIALAIEDQGIIRGLRNHLQPALDALEAIHARANATGRWVPTALWFYELDAVRVGLEMFGHQLPHLSARELHQAVRKLITRTQSSGTAAVYVQPQQIGLQGVRAAA
jgi:hypothetical protein